MNEEKLQELLAALNKVAETDAALMQSIRESNASAKRRLRWSTVVNVCSMLVNAVLIGLLLAR